MNFFGVNLVKILRIFIKLSKLLKRFPTMASIVEYLDG